MPDRTVTGHIALTVLVEMVVDVVLPFQLGPGWSTALTIDEATNELIVKWGENVNPKSSAPSLRKKVFAREDKLLQSVVLF